MNVRRTIENLNKKYPGKTIIQNKDDEDIVTEILCEIEPASEHPDWSNAIAVIDRSAPHHHKITTETYTVLSGTLTLVVKDKKIVLKEGDTYTITPDKEHYAIGKETWIECRSEPGWTIDDYIITQDTQ